MGSDDNQPNPPDLGAGHMDRALELVRFLRSECPWDREQTPESLIPHLLEEAHEVVDAIRESHDDDLEGELGDLLLNLAFQVVLGEERRGFTAASVMERLEKKMWARHPHLFGLGEKEDWEVLKARERKKKFGEGGFLRPHRHTHRPRSPAQGPPYTGPGQWSGVRLGRRHGSARKGQGGKSKSS